MVNIMKISQKRNLNFAETYILDDKYSHHVGNKREKINNLKWSVEEMNSYNAWMKI